MEKGEEKKVFRSRISVLLLGLILAIFIPVSLPMFQHKIYSGMCILGGTFAFIVLLFTGMRYIISGNKLYVKIWMIPIGSVKISDIVSVERSYNPLSSPAGSLKRLRIGSGKRTKYSYMLISPVREQEFIEDLKAINPNISVHVPIKKRVWRIHDWDI